MVTAIKSHLYFVLSECGVQALHGGDGPGQWNPDHQFSEADCHRYFRCKPCLDLNFAQRSYVKITGPAVSDWRKIIQTCSSQNSNVGLVVSYNTLRRLIVKPPRGAGPHSLLSGPCQYLISLLESKEVRV